MVKKLLTFITIFFLAKPVYSVNYKDYIPPKAYQYKNIFHQKHINIKTYYLMKSPPYFLNYPNTIMFLV